MTRIYWIHREDSIPDDSSKDQLGVQSSRSRSSELRGWNSEDFVNTFHMEVQSSLYIRKFKIAIYSFL
jgi:hypothetical protein